MTQFIDAFFETVSPESLLERYGSPLYVYKESVLRERCRELCGLSKHKGFKVCFSAKANTNPSVLRIIREEGCMADAMSPGELAMNMRAGFTPDEMVYVSNNIDGEELRAAVDAGLLVSVDSLSQLNTLGRVAPGARVMLRMNPGIGAGHHEKVITAGKATKFGISPLDLAEAKYIAVRYGLCITGVNQHIGSCFMEPEGYLAAARELLHIADKVRTELGIELEVIDFGGGFGIPYRKHEGEARLDLAALGEGLDALLDDWCAKTGYNGHFHIEPGRYLVAECGVLLGRVTATKYNGSTRYAGTDVGFNQLMRPILYDSYHEIEVCGAPSDAPLEPWNVVGNICESGDILARGRMLPPMKEGDIAAVLDVGAYGYVMASTYNQRPRPAEVMIGLDGQVRLIRRRETVEDLMRLTV